MKRQLARLLCCALAAPGCTAARPSIAPVTAPQQTTAARLDPALIADFVKQIPIGSQVRVDLVNGKVVRGTLMRRDTDPIVVQRRTRLPEPATEIRIADVVAIQLDQPGGGAGRTIAIGVAAGAGAALGVILLLAAIFAGS